MPRITWISVLLTAVAMAALATSPGTGESPAATSLNPAVEAVNAEIAYRTRMATISRLRALAHEAGDVERLARLEALAVKADAIHAASLAAARIQLDPTVFASLQETLRAGRLNTARLLDPMGTDSGPKPWDLFGGVEGERPSRGGGGFGSTSPSGGGKYVAPDPARGGEGPQPGRRSRPGDVEPRAPGIDPVPGSRPRRDPGPERPAPGPDGEPGAKPRPEPGPERPAPGPDGKPTKTPRPEPGAPRPAPGPDGTPGSKPTPDPGPGRPAPGPGCPKGGG